jgi:hypothetical protein
MRCLQVYPALAPGCARWRACPPRGDSLSAMVGSPHAVFASNQRGRPWTSPRPFRTPHASMSLAGDSSMAATLRSSSADHSCSAFT